MYFPPVICVSSRQCCASVVFRDHRVNPGIPQPRMCAEPLHPSLNLKLEHMVGRRAPCLMVRAWSAGLLLCLSVF